MWQRQIMPVLTNAEIEALVVQLRCESLNVRLSAIFTLKTSTIPSDAFDIADSLVEFLAPGTAPQLRKPAVEILTEFFMSTPKYAKAVFACLDAVHPVHIFRFPTDQMYVPEYVAAVRNSNAFSRGRFIAHLHAGPFDTAITQEVIAALSDQDADVRKQAIATLCSIFNSSKEQAALAKPALVEALKSPEHEIAFTAARALQTLDDDEETATQAKQIFDDTVNAGLFSEDKATRAEKLRELAGSTFNEVHLDRIVELLESSDDFHYAALVLERWGPNAKPAIPHIKRLLFKSRGVSESYCKILVAIDSPDQEVIDWLAKALFEHRPHQGGYDHHRMSAGRAFGLLGA